MNKFYFSDDELKLVIEAMYRLLERKQDAAEIYLDCMDKPPRENTFAIPQINELIRLLTRSE